MIYLCYFIVCVNLLYAFDQAEMFQNEKLKELQNEQILHLNSLTVENQDEYLANMVSPYWKLPYDEQLDKKQRSCRRIVDMIVKHFESLENPMTYKLLPIVPSPVTKAYINREIFHIRNGVDGNPKTVGCLVGKLSLGSAVCVFPKKIVTIKESHKRVAQVYEDFIRLSPLSVNRHLRDGGHWRTILVRSNKVGDIMASVTVQPIGYTNESILESQTSLKEYFFKHLPNITLFHQQCAYSRCPRKVAPYILLYGKPYLIETINGYKFKITPDTLIRLNTMGAEVLYDNAIRMAKLKPNTTVIDICSSSGIMSIMASKFVNEVIAIEATHQSFIDARDSAHLNNIHNAKFLYGDLNKTFRLVLRRLNPSSDVVAIVNAKGERPGLQSIKIIRSSSHISKVVYIYSKPEISSCVQNFVELCSSNISSFRPFRLTKAISIDILPQTPYFELILVFKRLPYENI